MLKVCNRNSYSFGNCRKKLDFFLEINHLSIVFDKKVSCFADCQLENYIP